MLLPGGGKRGSGSAEEIKSHSGRASALHHPLRRHAESGRVATPRHHRPTLDEVHPEGDLRRGVGARYRKGNPYASYLRILIDEYSAKRAPSERGHLENRSVLAGPGRGSYSLR